MLPHPNARSLMALLSIFLMAALASAYAGESQEAIEKRKAIAAEHYYLSNFYMKDWNLKMVEVELEEAIRYEPDMKAAHRNLSIVALMQWQFLKAFAETSVVIGLGEPIPLTASECKLLDQKASQLHYGLGLKHARVHNWGEAITEFEWALVYSPNNPMITRSLAFAYASNGNFVEAEKEYTSAFAADPKDGYSHADFAFLLSEKGQGKLAISEMSEAVKLEPEAAALHVDLGWLAESSGDLPKAASEFALAAKMSPKHAELWVHLGRLRQRQGEPDAAIAAYKKALEVDPERTDAKQKLHELKELTL